MPRNSAAKKKQATKKEEFDARALNEQIRNITAEQEIMGRVMDEMKKVGVRIPTANGNKILKVRASKFLDIRIKMQNGEELKSEEKIIAEHYKKRVKELMKK